MLKTPNATRMVFFREAGFFLDEIESPERVTMSEIRLSGCLHTSRIVADSVKNSSESSISERGYCGFCFKKLFPWYLCFGSAEPFAHSLKIKPPRWGYFGLSLMSCSARVPCDLISFRFRYRFRTE